MSVSAAFRSGQTARPRPGAGVVFARHRGLLTAVGVFLLLFALVNAISAGHLTYFDISFMASGSATLVRMWQPGLAVEYGGDRART